jgi:NTE family protein
MAITEHGAAAYTALPKPQRKGTALALSGGGFRAALFHLGALRRLNELGVLSRVDTVSSVSGGSILAAFMMERLSPWPEPGSIAPQWDERLAHPFKRFAATNIRTWPVAKRLLPWNWLRSTTAVEALAVTYRKRLSGRLLTGLPERPRFIFCATDLPFAVNWIFEKVRAGDYQAGYTSTPPEWLVARAVAASSCFPPVFSPLPIGLRPDRLLGGKAPPGRERDKIVRSIRLSDGGVYDNLGLEPVWKDHAVLLTSDGGATFDAGPDRGFFWRLKQYTAVMSRQAGAIRKRWLISNFTQGELGGTYWGIGSSAGSYGFSGGYSENLVDRVVSEVRTDFDAFSEAEQAVLENHGYILAEAAIRRHAPELISGEALPYSVPNPDWMDEERVRKALSSSHRCTLVGRWSRA